MAIRNSIIFGGVNSADYGIYIGGEGTFNAPKRAVEMVSVPGRDGAIPIDQGYYENINVKYSAFNYEEDMDSFTRNLRSFRNAIASLHGYQKLSDTFHPDEYRMGVYVEELEIKPIMYNTASKFEIEFNCIPHRFLIAGDDEIDIGNGSGSLYNPTAFNAKPMLMVNGYGNIAFNGYNIAVENDVFGDIELAPAQTREKYASTSSRISFDHLSNGDSIYVKGYQGTIKIKLRSTAGYLRRVAVGTRSPFNLPVSIGNETRVSNQEIDVQIFTYEDITGFTAPRGEEELSVGVSIVATIEDSGGSTSTRTYEGTVRLIKMLERSQGRDYDIMDLRATFTPSGLDSLQVSAYLQLGEVRGVSTKSVLGTPTYIDCDLGDAYLIENGAVVSLNRYITFGSDLPTLAPGENTITVSGNITALSVIPHWRIL